MPFEGATAETLLVRASLLERVVTQLEVRHEAAIDEERRAEAGAEGEDELDAPARDHAEPLEVGVVGDAAEGVGDGVFVERAEGECGVADDFGQSLAFVGDVDGDSAPDFVIGIPGDDSAANGGGGARRVAAPRVRPPRWARLSPGPGRRSAAGLCRKR